MNHTVVHGEMSDGQFLLDDRRQITGIVDWDGLHVGHPLLDLDFGVDLYRIYEAPGDSDRLRRRIWNAYAAERGGELPDWKYVRLFWCILDVTTLLREQDKRLPAAVADLDTATGTLHS